MPKSANPVPEGYHAVTPYLVVRGAARLLDFIKQTFEARLIQRVDWLDGSVAHAELQIGDSILMLAEARGAMQPMPTAIYLYVDDVDAVYRRALHAGAESISEPADQFYGDRQGSLRDPAGNQWWIATHIEDLSREELARRSEKWVREASERPAAM